MNEYLATLDRLDELEDQLNRRFSKLHRKLDKILTMLEDWDAPIMEGREGVGASLKEELHKALIQNDILSMIIREDDELRERAKFESIWKSELEKDGWISSDERLPEEYESVEVLDRGKCFVSNRPNEDVWIEEDESVSYADSISSTKGTYWREIQ